MTEQRLRHVDPNKLKPHPKNSNTHSETQVADLARSIRQFGFVKPIVADEDGVILAGHGVHLAALNMGLDKVPVVYKSGLSDHEKRAYLIADNRLAEMSKWDRDMVVAELAELDGFEFEHLGSPRALFADSKLLNGVRLATDDARDESSAPLYSDDEVIDDAFEWYREHGFPFRDVPLHVAKQSMNRLAELHGNALLSSVLCYDVADTYHPHRFKAHAQGKKSPYESFFIDKSLRKAIAKQLEQGRVGRGYIGFMSLVTNTQACSNFRPAFAKHLYELHCADDARVLDTSTGYGGRMLGFAASLRSGHYVGIDPCVETHEANLRMARDLGFADRVTLINAPAEDVTPEQIGAVDFAFTSPPYFAKELYSDEDTQSWKRYSTIDAWIEGFLVPMLELQHACLVDGATSIVNIADVKIGGEDYPLERLTIESAEQVGFTHVETMRFRLPERVSPGDTKEAFEPVLVFSKQTRVEL